MCLATTSTKINRLSMFMCQRITIAEWITIAESTKFISATHHNHAENRNRRNDHEDFPECHKMPWNAKCHVITNLPCNHQIAMKCQVPCNHQFERRYITPTVTYAEKPNRVQLNLSVNWLIYWVPDIYLRNQMEQVVLT